MLSVPIELTFELLLGGGSIASSDCGGDSTEGIELEAELATGLLLTAGTRDEVMEEEVEFNFEELSCRLEELLILSEATTTRLGIYFEEVEMVTRLPLLFDSVGCEITTCGGV